MTRFMLAIVAVLVLSGCQYSGQQAIDPFWGRTTVPPTATGLIGAPIMEPAGPQPLQAPVITQGMPLPGSMQATTPPSLLPAPSPGGPATVAPAPAGTGGTAVPHGNGASVVSPAPPSYTAPDRAPLSGYSNPDSSLAAPASPAVTVPGSAPAATNSPWPTQPVSPGSTAPSTNGAAPAGPSPAPSVPTGPPPASSTPASPAPTPAPTPAPGGSPPGNPSPGGTPPGYLPPDGFKFPANPQGSSGYPVPGVGVNGAVPNTVAAVPVSLNGATVSAPPSVISIPSGQ